MNIYFNNMCSKDLELEIIKKPYVPSPKKKMNTVQLQGKDGDYYIDEGTYEDITIPIEFNFEYDPNKLELKEIQIKNWLNNISDNTLKFENSMFYYKVKNIEMEDIQYSEVYEINTFTANFICEAYKYLYSDKKKIINNNTIIKNMYSTAKPIYYIVGNGTLTVNGNIVNITNNSGQLKIDTDIGKVFLNNISASGLTNIKYMEDLYLKHGKNIISYNGINLEIKKNLRTI